MVIHSEKHGGTAAGLIQAIENSIDAALLDAGRRLGMDEVYIKPGNVESGPGHVELVREVLSDRSSVYNLHIS